MENLKENGKCKRKGEGYDPSVMDRKHEKRRKMPLNICDGKKM